MLDWAASSRWTIEPVRLVQVWVNRHASGAECVVRTRHPGRTLALCGGATPVEAAEIANHASGVVVGKLGTATVTPDELIASIATD